MHGYSLSVWIPRVRFNPVLDVFHVGRLCTMQLFGVTAQLAHATKTLYAHARAAIAGVKNLLCEKHTFSEWMSGISSLSLSCFLKTKCYSRRVVEGFRQLEWFSVFVSFSLTHTFTMQYFFCIRSVGQDNKSCFSFSPRPKIRSCDFPSCTKQPKLSCSVQGLPHFPIWSFLLLLLGLLFAKRLPSLLQLFFWVNFFTTITFLSNRSLGCNFWRRRKNWDDLSYYWVVHFL